MTISGTVVGVYIKRMKTIFELNFVSYQAVKQHGYTIHKHRNKEKLSFKSFSLTTW